MFDISHIIYLLLPLLPQKLQAFCSIENGLKFIFVFLALEEGLVEMVQAFKKPSWGAMEGCENEDFYIDFQFGPTLEQKLNY